MKRLYGLVGVVGTLTLAGSVLGYVRNASITSVFGLSGDSDAYFVAIFLPNILQAVLVLGALAPALVHVYVNYIEAGRPDDARTTFSSVLNLVAVVVGLIVLTGVFFSRSLVGVIAPGLSNESADTSAGLMSFTLPLLLLLCLAGVLGPVLNTRDHFFAPALNSLIINACTIAFVVIGGKRIGVEAAAAGVLLGGILHVALLLFFVRRKGIAYSLTMRLGHPGVRRVLVQSAPVVLYMGIAYCAPLLDRALASMVTEGGVSIVTIAVTLFVLPTIVFNGSLGIVLYPQLVRDAAADREKYARTLAQAARVLLAVLVPVSVLMAAASVPLMRLAYGPGDVASSNVHTGAAVLAVYVVALSFVGLTQILQKAIYAGGDFTTPLKVELMTLGLYAAAAIALSHVWALVGLALARAGHHILTTFVTFHMVRRLPEVPSLRRLGRFALRPLLASAPAAAFYGIAFLALDCAHPSPSYALTALEQPALLLVAGGVYLAAASFLRVEEVRVLWRLAPIGRRQAAVTQEAA